MALLSWNILLIILLSWPVGLQSGECSFSPGEMKNLTGIVGGSILLPACVKSGFLKFENLTLASVKDSKMKIKNENYNSSLQFNNSAGCFTLTHLQKNNSGIYYIDFNEPPSIQYFNLTVYESLTTENTLTVSAENMTHNTTDITKSPTTPAVNKWVVSPIIIIIIIIIIISSSIISIIVIIIICYKWRKTIQQKLQIVSNICSDRTDSEPNTHHHHHHHQKERDNLNINEEDVHLGAVDNDTVTVNDNLEANGLEAAHSLLPRPAPPVL